MEGAATQTAAEPAAEAVDADEPAGAAASAAAPPPQFTADPPIHVVPAAAAVDDDEDDDNDEPGAGPAEAAAGGGAPAQPAHVPPSVYTPPADPRISLTFRNPASFSVKIYWRRSDTGELAQPTLVLPGRTATVKTYANHYWDVFKARLEDLQHHATAFSTKNDRVGIHILQHTRMVMRDSDKAGLSAMEHKALRRHMKAHLERNAVLDDEVPEPQPEPQPPPPPIDERLRVVRVFNSFGYVQECDVATGAFIDGSDATANNDPSQLDWSDDRYTDQLKRLDFDQLRHMVRMLGIGSFEHTAHLVTPARKVCLVAMITHKMEQIRGLSMPKLRAAAMNAGVDADDLALGVEFERTLSANSKLLKQSSKFEVDEHDDGPANPEDREEILEKIMRSLHDGTQQYAPCPEFQAILDEQYGPVVLPDDMETVPAAVVDAAGADADADSSSTALGAAASSSADQSNRPDPARPPPGEFFLAKLGPDMVRAVCTHLALTIQGGPQLKRLQATCRGMRDALAADEPEIHELWELAARSRFVEEIDELLPADIEKLQDVDTVTVIRAEARTAQAFDNGLSANVKRELWSATPLPRKPGRPSSGGVPPVLRPEDVGFGAYKRLHELRAQFKETVTVVRGSISDLPFHVDAIVLPSDESSMLNVGFGACGAIYRAADGPDKENKLLDKYMRKTYPKQCGLTASGAYSRSYEPNPVGTVLPSPSFAMSDRCTTLLHAVGPTWPSGSLDSLGRAVRWCRLGGGEERVHSYTEHSWGWYRDHDGTLTGAADGLGHGTPEEAELAMEPEFAEKAALIKYHATMLRRQLVRELCVVYENIFDRAAERECKSIAIPGAVPAVHASRDITELRNLKPEGVLLDWLLHFVTGISTGARGFPNLTAAAVAMDIVQQRIAAGTCPAKVYFVAFDDSSNIYGSFSDVRHEILRRYELLIRPVSAQQPWVWRGGGWRGISEQYDAGQASTLASNRNYLATLEQQLEDLDADKKSGPEGLSLMRQIDSARSQVANAEQEIAQAEEDEEARRKFDAEHGALPEGVPGDCEPEPELEDGANILDAIDEEYTLMPLRRSITIHNVDLTKEYTVAKRATSAYTYMIGRI